MQQALIIVLDLATGAMPQPVHLRLLAVLSPAVKHRTKTYYSSYTP